jgi:hypothetical protein
MAIKRLLKKGAPLCARPASLNFKQAPSPQQRSILLDGSCKPGCHGLRSAGM